MEMRVKLYVVFILFYFLKSSFCYETFNVCLQFIEHTLFVKFLRNGRTGAGLGAAMAQWITNMQSPNKPGSLV